MDYVTDARWNEIKDIDVKVVPPDFLRNIDTNIVIASGRKEVAIEIVSSLMNMGISTKRIIWNDLIVKEEMFFEKMFQDSFSEMLSNAVLKNKVILQRINNRTEYEKFVSNNREIFIYEDVLSSFYKKNTKATYNGYCEVCEKKVSFLPNPYNMFLGNKVQFREGLICPSCGLNNRMRFMYGFVSDRIKNSSDNIYINEQVTSLYKSFLKYPNITGSEYLGADKISGKKYKGIRHEDAMNLSFDNESMHYYISNDVFEHTADYKKTFQEAYRILKFNGELIFTVPFYVNENDISVKAKDVNGKIEYISLPPVYHGNPIGDGRALVFTDFGWGLLNELKQIGFSDAYILVYFDAFHANIGDFSYLIIAKK